MRYLTKSLDIVERLVRIQRVKDSSTEGLFNTLQDILKESSLSLKDAVGQSYDGASVMTGKYKGVKILVQHVNPQCLFIWTFDHVLNLVVMEVCGSSLAAKSLFGVLDKLYAFFSQSRKRSDILEKQKESNIQQIHRPQRVSTTRWWSHQKALENVFFAHQGELFECFIDTLEQCQSTDHSRQTITDAEALEKKLTSFETVLTAHVFNKIFSITDPASLYLQSEKIDLLTAIRLIETAESHLEQLRGEFSKVHALAKMFCVDHELEQDFASKSRFPELYTLYKILVTLPIGSTKCERTFSKLKFVKNNLRSSV